MLDTRFWSKVQMTSTCWLWLGSKAKTGHGQYTINRKLFQAHRLVFEVLYGPNSNNRTLYNTCQNTSCINPAHWTTSNPRLGVKIGPKSDVQERLWGRIKKLESGCWEWLGAKDELGYGIIKVDGKTMATHRLSYALTNGFIPNGLLVLHKCDNPSCCNPDHLFVGTQLDNVWDSINKGRHITFGHKRI
jgi:hypothetical protein